MPLFEEALLEPIARHFRFQHGLKHIPLNQSLVIVDLGCGPKIRFYHFAKAHGVQIKRYLGIDPLVSDSVSRSQSVGVTILNTPLKKKIPLPKATADLVTAFAFFEHIDYPKKILAEAYRILKPGGRIILTVPSPKAKTILEFLALGLKIISTREIKEHRRYLDHYSLLKLLPITIKRAQTHHGYFELGMNNLFILKK